MCGDLKILPRSHVLSISLLKTGEWPISSRGPCDAYEGILNGSKVCVKRLRVYSNGEPEAAKHVCNRRFYISPSFLTIRIGILPGGDRVEAFGTPKHCPTPRGNRHPPPVGFSLDAWRGAAGIYRNEPVCRPSQSRRFLPYYVE